MSGGGKGYEGKAGREGASARKQWGAEGERRGSGHFSPFPVPRCVGGGAAFLSSHRFSPPLCPGARLISLSSSFKF